MDELDLLKKDWKRNENSYNQLSEKEIYKMLHKRSSSIVKWILVISILEVVAWTSVNFISGTDDYLKELGLGEMQVYLRIFDIFNYAVILVFIYLFYRNYIRISTTASTKELMSNIIRTRKTVNYYVWYNLVMIMLITMFGFAIAFFYSPIYFELREKIKEDSMVLCQMIAVMVFCIALFTTIFWVVYRLVYGILLRKLLGNYRELKKIDF